MAGRHIAPEPNGHSMVTRVSTILFVLVSLALWGWVIVDIAYPDPDPLPTERGSGFSLLMMAFIGQTILIGVWVVTLCLGYAGRRLFYGR